MFSFSSPASPSLGVRSVNGDVLLILRPMRTSWESDFICSLCSQTINDAHGTKCGHSFCYKCINQHISTNNICPCGQTLESSDIFPNFVLNCIIRKARAEWEKCSGNIDSPVAQTQRAIKDCQRWTVQQLEVLIRTLQEKRRQKEGNEESVHYELLLYFLRESKHRRLQLMEDIRREIDQLDLDIELVETHPEVFSTIRPPPPLEQGETASCQVQVHIIRPSLSPSPSSSSPLPAPLTEASSSTSDKSRGSGVLPGPGACIGTGTSGAGSKRSFATAFGDGVIEVRECKSSKLPLPQNTSLDWHTSSKDQTPVAIPIPMSLPLAPIPGHKSKSTGRSSSPSASPSARTKARAATLSHSIVQKHRRIHEHFSDLETCYFETRGKDFQRGRPKPNAFSLSPLHPAQSPEPSAPLNVTDTASFSPAQVPSSAWDSDGRSMPSSSGAGVDGGIMRSSVQGLHEFAANLSNFTRFSHFQLVATLEPPDTSSSHANIISSIEFDNQQRLFATAGVMRHIKIYDYESSCALSQDQFATPRQDIAVRSKLSSVSWSPVETGHVMAGDYEGAMTLWDVETAKPISIYEEHEKRVWSIDVARDHPVRWVSGSDDGRVKLWTPSSPASIATIEIPNCANICTVRFNPSSPYNLAAGAADHKIYYFDIRQLRQAALTLSHRKAVAYVRFMNRNEIAASSTDSTIKLWDISVGECTRSFTGHMNERNFTGLAASDEFLACGSEDNAVYAWHTPLPRPLMSYSFLPPRQNPLDMDDSDMRTSFISAVCWRQNALIAANSAGSVKIIELMTC